MEMDGLFHIMVIFPAWEHMDMNFPHSWSGHFGEEKTLVSDGK
jgi:hypothetical protein